MKCIICQGELTEEDPGCVRSLIVGRTPNSFYSDDRSVAYHNKCEKQFIKWDEDESKKRLKTMGILK